MLDLFNAEGLCNSQEPELQGSDRAAISPAVRVTADGPVEGTAKKDDDVNECRNKLKRVGWLLRRGYGSTPIYIPVSYRHERRNENNARQGIDSHDVKEERVGGRLRWPKSFGEWLKCGIVKCHGRITQKQAAVSHGGIHVRGKRRRSRSSGLRVGENREPGDDLRQGIGCDADGVVTRKLV